MPLNKICLNIPVPKIVSKKDGRDEVSPFSDDGPYSPLLLSPSHRKTPKQRTLRELRENGKRVRENQLLLCKQYEDEAFAVRQRLYRRVKKESIDLLQEQRTKSKRKVNKETANMLVYMKRM